MVLLYSKYSNITWEIVSALINNLDCHNLPPTNQTLDLRRSKKKKEKEKGKCHNVR
jgi:hypothetical protein